jgi:serine/threonine protein phosphatase PrpC
MFCIEYAYGSDVGAVRPTNQDSVFGIADIIDARSCGLFCVADGMGGLADGEYASSLAVQSLEDWWHIRLEPLLRSHRGRYVHERVVFQEFSTLLTSVNQALLRHANEIEASVGTTCSILFILDDVYHIAHLGDTRIYVAQKKFMGYHISPLTEDHTWATDHIGILSDEEIAAHPKRNRLTSCLGVFESPRIFYSSGLIDKSKMFMLFTDGLYRTLSLAEIAKMLSKNNGLETLVSKMLRASIKRGATDNISAVAVRFERGSV